MKTKSLRILVIGLASALLTPFASAGPGPQYWTTLRSAKQFSSVKPGDKVAYVCNQCKTVTETTVESADKVMELCKEGAKVSCPACKMETKVVTKKQRNDPPTAQEVTYVNAKGEECLFVAKVDGSKK